MSGVNAALDASPGATTAPVSDPVSDPTSTAGARVHTLARLAPWLVAIAAFGSATAAIGAWPVGVFQDDGVYMVLAKSLATGEGYRYLNIPGAPNATHYPPIYPAFLALLWKLNPAFPQNVTMFKFANALLLGGAAALFHAFARQRLQLGQLASALSVAAFTACAPVVLLTVMVLSEPMFLCGLAATLILADRAAASGRPRDAALAGATSAVLALVRTLGIVVVPATVLVMAWRRQWRGAFTLGAVAVALSIPWQLWVGTHAAEVPPIYLGKYGSYLGWLADAVRTDGWVFVRDVAWANLTSLVAQGWASTATDTLNVYVRNTTSIGLAFFFGLGLGALWRRTPAVALFLVFYLGIVVIWPFFPARFTWGVWPLVGLVYGLAAVTVWGSSRRIVRFGGVAPLAALAVGYGGYNYLGVTRDWWTVVQKSVADRARPLAEWVVANTDSSAVVATDDDVLIYLYTGRRAIPNGAFTPQEHLVAQTPDFAVRSLRTILSTYHVDYVLASTSYGTYAVTGLVQAQPPELRIVRALATGGVFAPPTGPEGK